MLKEGAGPGGGGSKGEANSGKEMEVPRWGKAKAKSRGRYAHYKCAEALPLLSRRAGMLERAAAHFPDLAREGKQGNKGRGFQTRLQNVGLQEIVAMLA